MHVGEMELPMDIVKQHSRCEIEMHESVVHINVRKVLGPMGGRVRGVRLNAKSRHD